MKVIKMMRRGYILFLTISMLAVITIIVTQIFYVGGAYNLYVPLTYERERAKQLALSGISIATAQLLLQDKQLYGSKTVSKDDTDKREKKSEKKSDDEKTSKNNPEQNSKDLLKTLLLVQNKWQEFNLSTAKDGLDGKIKICITCEDGKINCNKLYNSAKKSFYRINSSLSTEPMIKMVADRMKDFFNGVDVETVLMSVLKKQKQPYVSPMDMLTYKSFSFFSDYIFYLPEDSKKQEKSDDIVNSKLYLADLFTTYYYNFYIDPWLFSNSLQLLFGLHKNSQLKKEDIEMMLEKISVSNSAWEQVWDATLKEVYGKEFKALPKEILPFLSTKFEPRVFSVVCYGKVGRIEQKLLAILERSTEDKGDVVTIKKIYWL